MSETRCIKITKNILWMVTGFGVSAEVARLIHGLGATTALTDETTWGIWIGFDVMGGFVIAGLVYIFHLKCFSPFSPSSDIWR